MHLPDDIRKAIKRWAYFTPTFEREFSIAQQAHLEKISIDGGY